MGDNRLKEIRTRIGLTQDEFAQFFDIPVKSYRNWEQNRTECPFYVISMICRIIMMTEDNYRRMGYDPDWKALSSMHVPV